MMANDIDTTYNFNSDAILDDFSTSLQESIKNIVLEEGYKRHRIEKKNIPQPGNFLSFLYEVDIRGETDNGEKETSLFIKKSITMDKIETAAISDLYDRELFVYNDLFKTYATLQESADVPDSEKVIFIKKYNSDNESVIMENLSKKGFKTYENTQVVPLKFAELSVIQLAKLHALSYVTKKRFPKYFEVNIEAIEHPCHVNSDWVGFVHNICAAIGEVVNDDAKDKITNYAERMIKTYCKYVMNDVPTNGCLCHGDYKFLNIMVKEVDGEASAVHPIDYQLMYYGNPINDFLFFVFTSTDRDLRSTHLNYLKDLYFDNFAKFLSYFDVDVNSTYSRQEFEADYNERLELGLVFGFYLSVFTFAHVEDGFDVRKRSLSELAIVPDEFFTSRVRGIVQDYIDWGYL